MASEQAMVKLLEALVADFKIVHNECKKKHPQIKEGLELGMVKLRMLSSAIDDGTIQALSDSSEVFNPLLLGCKSGMLKIIPTCLTSLQRLASAAAISQAYAVKVVDVLSTLAKADTENLRVLQTIIVLLTTSTAVQKDSLAKTVVLCFKLYFSADTTTSNTASAAIRQIIAVVTDRMIEEDRSQPEDDETTSLHTKCPRTLRPRAQDAYLLFQDLCQLTNGDNPYWLQGMTTMTRTFGLELLESILRHYPKAFLDHPEFSFLLKERVCPLVIKLFSPNIKYRNITTTTTQPTIVEKPVFSVSVRLLRIVSVLIQQFYTLLVTECEIFLSLLVKFLDGDKPFWQRALALEVLQMLCTQPLILKSFCEYYDMQEHATKILHDICQALGVFVQSLFAKEAAHSLANPSLTNQLDSSQPSHGDKPANQASGFLYKGAWIPVNNFNSPTKPLYLEQLDFKAETTTITSSYGMKVVFSCLTEVCSAVHHLVNLNQPAGWGTTVNGDVDDAKSEEIAEGDAFTEDADTTAAATKDKNIDKTGVGSEAMRHSLSSSSESPDLSPVWLKMVEVTWESMLATLTILLEASTDDTATERLLSGLQTYASVCGQLNLSTQRDSFISTICRASLPTNYASGALNAALLQRSTPESTTSTMTPSTDLSAVVIVVTSKNIHCMRSLLNLAQCYGNIVTTAWHMILSTLRHLVQLLRIRLATSGGFRMAASADQTLIQATLPPTCHLDVPVLDNMLTKLFESSSYLDDVSLHHLVDALCRLSSEDMEQHATGSTREPCLFAIAKMLETGLVNMPRLLVLWRTLTGHLLEVSQHPHARLREWGAHALTSLIKQAIVFEHDEPLTEDLSTQLVILSPLQSLASIGYSDVRLQQFECVLQVLQDWAPQLGKAWPVILKIIGSATNQQNEAIIRLGFQSLQLVVTDFLPIMPCWCVRPLIDVAGRFGLQPNEINISLTSVGLLWNLSDFLYQNRTTLKRDLDEYVQQQPKLCAELPTGGSPLHTSLDLFPAVDMSVPAFDGLWMSLYGKLGELCVDTRPAVRKSAGQTLFSTISAHGGLLQNQTWYHVLWKVLFPLLETVKASSLVAADCPPPSDNTQQQGNILIHHTRDTAEKQWAETSVLTLAGVARVFSARSHILRELEDYPRAWALLLEMIEAGALSHNSEVALNSLKSFQEIIQDQQQPTVTSVGSSADKNSIVDAVAKPQVQFYDISASDSAIEMDLWSNAWRVWQNIGQCSMTAVHFIRNVKDASGKLQAHNVYPSQPFLAALVNVFPPLFGRIYSRFGVGDLQCLCKVLIRTVSMPLHSDTSPFLLPAFHEASLSPLQQSVLHAMQVLREPIMQLTNRSVLDVAPDMYPMLFELLLTFVEFACCPPKVESHDERNNRTNVRGRAGEWVVMNYVPLAEQAMSVVRDLYLQSHSMASVVEAGVLESILRTLHLPLKLKYACPFQSTWKLALALMLSVTPPGAQVHISMNEPEGKYKSMWLQLAQTIEDFLFSTSPPPDSQTLAQHKADEKLDMDVLLMVKENILPDSVALPQVFVEHIMRMLNKGSIHAATSSMFDGDSAAFPMKEDFAKLCFETLLQFSFVNEKDGNNHASGSLTKSALNSLLDRCKNVLLKFAEDERLNGKFPLPRARMFEMSFAIKAISALLASLKKTNKTNPTMIDASMWSEMIAMYPALLECVTCSEESVRHTLKDALREFQDLITIPNSYLNDPLI